jgi:hypothetical protein
MASINTLMNLKEELQKMKQYLEEAEKAYAEVTKEVDGIDNESVFEETTREAAPQLEKEKIPLRLLLVCKDCVTKHLAAASKIMEEAVVFAERGQKDEAVRAVRDAMRELAGMERDIPVHAPEGYQKIRLLEGEIRKAIVRLGLEYEPDIEKLKKIAGLIDELREFAYGVMKTTK